ncbi:hypothetical protein ACLBXX_05805 [Microbacterium sp. C23T]
MSSQHPRTKAIATKASRTAGGPMPHGGRQTTLAFWIITGGIAAIVAITLAVIVYTLNRGFDWSDEGFVHVMNSSGRQASGEFWGFQLLLHPVYVLFGNSILAFRVLRLLGYIALSIILVVIARSALEAVGFRLKRSSWILVLLVAQAGTFAAWSYPPRYLGYNELSSWLTLVGGALLILLIVRGRLRPVAPSTREGWILYALWAAVGFVVGTLFVAKITGAMVFGALAVIVALMPSRAGRRWPRIGFLAAGVAVAALVMLIIGVPIVAYTRSVVELLINPAAREATGYSVGGLPQLYLWSASTTLGALAVPIILAAVALMVSFGVPRGRGIALEARVVARLEQVTLVLAAVLLLIVVFIPMFPPGGAHIWDALGMSISFTFFAALLALAVMFPGTPAPGEIVGNRTVTMSVVIGLFALIPLVSGAGTSNSIMGHTVFSATLWAVGAAVALVALWERSTASSAVRMIPLLLAGAVVAAGGLAVAGDVFTHPYRTAPYLAQKTEVTVADFRGLRLLADEAELVTWLSETGEELDAAGVPALSMSSPGSLLAFNASGWVNPWPGPDWAQAITRACGGQAPEDFFVIQSESQEPGVTIYDQVPEGLEGCGVQFPEDFEVVAEHPSDNPGQDVTIWRLSEQ